MRQNFTKSCETFDVEIKLYFYTVCSQSKRMSLSFNTPTNHYPTHLVSLQSFSTYHPNLGFVSGIFLPWKTKWKWILLDYSTPQSISQKYFHIWESQWIIYRHTLQKNLIEIYGQWSSTKMCLSKYVCVKANVNGHIFWVLKAQTCRPTVFL